MKLLLTIKMVYLSPTKTEEYTHEEVGYLLPGKKEEVLKIKKEQ